MIKMDSKYLLKSSSLLIFLSLSFLSLFFLRWLHLTTAMADLKGQDDIRLSSVIEREEQHRGRRARWGGAASSTQRPGLCGGGQLDAVARTRLTGCVCGGEGKTSARRQGQGYAALTSRTRSIQSVGELKHIVQQRSCRCGMGARAGAIVSWDDGTARFSLASRD